jgi:hypothetical protein
MAVLEDESRNGHERGRGQRGPLAAGMDVDEVVGHGHQVRID